MIVTEHSLWLLPLCIIPGVLYAGMVYWRVHKPEMPRNMKIALSVMRGFAVSAIAFLLLHPIVNSTQKEVEKPVIAVGIDNSQSVLLTDSLHYYTGSFRRELQQVLQDMSRRYQVDVYTIDDGCHPGDSVDYSGKKTDISSFFHTVESAYYRKNLGAVVLLSDGIANTGSSPLYAAQKIKAPIYTVAMGDTTPTRDALIAKVNYNKTVYLNNVFPIEILVKAQDMAGKSATLTLYEDGIKVMEQPVHYSGSSHVQWVKTSFEARKAGLHTYKMNLSVADGEITPLNNTCTIAIQVLDKRKKVAIVYASPHPDVAAVARSLASSDAYEVESYPIAGFNKPAGEYDIMVLHGLPIDAKSKTLVNDINYRGMPCVYMPCNMDMYNAFNSSDAGMQVLNKGSMTNEAYPEVNPNFSGISLMPSTADFLGNVTPVEVPMAYYQPGAQCQVVLYQKIGKVSTRYPLLVLMQGHKARGAVLLGNGWWRWRMCDYVQSSTWEHFDDLILKIFQYVGIQEDKSFFRVKGKQVYAENEPIVFDAELYNANYEPVNTPEVLMEIQGENQKHQFAFTRYGKMYRLQAGSLPQGTYLWKATTTFNNEHYERSGSFVVQEVNMEALNITADYQLLYNLAAQSGGKCYSDKQLDLLRKHICNRTDLKPVAHYHTLPHPMAERIWVPVLLILLMCGEYFIRKWHGGY